ERSALADAFPGPVGSMDGAPAAMRDQANRQLLRLTAATAPPEAAAGLKSVGDALKIGDGSHRAMLLGFNPAGTGEAVVSLGDPDKAKTVVTSVPGIAVTDWAPETAKNSVYRGAQRANAVLKAAGDDPGTASVFWLGYTPQPTIQGEMENAA